MPSEVGKQFEELWESNDSPPDVFSFLQQHHGLAASEILAVLLQDQRYRWRTNQPLEIEDYLANFPALAKYKVKFALGELRARQLDATSVDVAEFASRFPDLGENFRVKLSGLELAGELTMEVAEVGGRWVRSGLPTSFRHGASPLCCRQGPDRRSIQET